MSEFAVIPVLDLKGGTVVHAKGGKRADYRPLETPFGPADDPLAIARGLLDATLSPFLYVADLDAIEGRGNNYSLCRDLADVLPRTTLWIDAGFSDADECAFWLPLDATLVIGSETLASHDAWKDIHANLGDGALLSLDFDGDAMRGPQPLLTGSEMWPDRLIVMSLTRVGTGEGPDFAQIKDVIGRSGARGVYAAGGVRNIEDLKRARDEGARGALIATALHSGAVTQKEIAALT
jgi:phosphoribosylformimino-5-aminoimidazole carboxamide ribotide isomerase